MRGRAVQSARGGVRERARRQGRVRGSGGARRRYDRGARQRSQRDVATHVPIHALTCVHAHVHPPTRAAHADSVRECMTLSTMVGGARGRAATRVSRGAASHVPAHALTCVHEHAQMCSLPLGSRTQKGSTTGNDIDGPISSMTLHRYIHKHEHMDVRMLVHSARRIVRHIARCMSRGTMGHMVGRRRGVPFAHLNVAGTIEEEHGGSGHRREDGQQLPRCKWVGSGV